MFNAITSQLKAGKRAGTELWRLITAFLVMVVGGSFAPVQQEEGGVLGGGYCAHKV